MKSRRIVASILMSLPLFGLEWTTSHGGTSIEAYGKYGLSKDTLSRSFDFPDPPSPDTAEIWKPKTAVSFAGDTLVAAGHRYLRPDEGRHCGTLWKTFDPDPDPPTGGGGGGGGDWD